MTRQKEKNYSICSISGRIRKMKIACIGYLHGAGGAEKQIIMLSNALFERGHEVHLISG